MKYRIALLCFLSLYISTLLAQQEQTKSYSLNWKNLEKWYSNSSSIQVLSFDGAYYPFENRLPYFHEQIPCDPTFSYRPEIKNPVYIPTTNEESSLLSSNNSFGSEPKFITSFHNRQGANFFNVNILPFINKDGRILKLQSFDLQITKESNPQKIALKTNHTYASNSILSQGKFIKIKVVDSGVYKLTYEDLASMGLDPANVHIFGYGGNVLEQDFSLPKIDDLPELAIYMNKGTDGIFNAGDYVLFYAQGINKWTYDKSAAMFTHTINPYSRYGCYFVTSNTQTGKRIEDKVIILPDPATINTVNEFSDYNVYEKEVVNLAQSGKVFYQPLGDANSLNVSFNAPNIVLSNTTKVRLDVASSSSATSIFTLSLNGGQANTLFVNQLSGDNYEQGVGTSGTFTFTPVNDALAFNLSYSKPTSTSLGYLNFIELNNRRKLKMVGSEMPFQNVDYLGQSAYSRYQLNNTNLNVQIWDITDPQNIATIPTTIIDGNTTFVDSSNDLKNYLAIDPTASTAYSKPEIGDPVPNQNLHTIAQADMVIITHPDFLTQAQTLAQAHREKDNLTVEIVTTDQVYNEFSSGTPDATAYRWLMKMLYDRALSSNKTADLPKYLLLFGKGTYDNRKIRSESGENLILTYQADNSLITTSSYVTDDYFALLDDNEGSDIPNNSMDIGVGRFPVVTVEQATDVVNKTIMYMNNLGKGSWKNQICFLADDGGNGDGNIHMSQADDVATSIASAYPAYQIDKIYLDAYLQEISASGESYPLAKNRFMNSLNSGLFLIDFTGHAGPTGWTNESILSLADVKALSNQHLPLFVAATCDFSQFDVQSVSGGEQVILNPTGGGIGILSSARPVYSSGNFPLNKLICNILFEKQNGKQLRIGDVIALAKNSLNEGINKLPYVYLGDPAVMLNYPTKYNVVTSQINKNSNLGNDTLRALSIDTIRGYIADDNGKIMTNFNGTLHAIIYDKAQRITTLNNHNEPNGSLTYSDRPNILFSGDVKVLNGAYNFSFMLPKDIKYNYGGGRIDYYAKDETNDFEAQGYYENFIIGGTDKKPLNDTIGPDVKLYLNSENFISGGKVNEAPLFIANVNDIHGINTIGSGIGHDILLTIDQSSKESHILNDYFQANADSYTGGTVSYKLPIMENGKHSLTFRVWDLLNNSTTQTLDFQVNKGLKPVIFSVNTYPNPVKTQANIVVKHDRPETVLQTTVEIFDIIGRKIWSFSQSSANNITWDLLTDDGRKVKTGVYLYRVNIKVLNSDITSKTNKMLIIE
jgi:hypothetical protein